MVPALQLIASVLARKRAATEMPARQSAEALRWITSVLALQQAATEVRVREQLEQQQPVMAMLVSSTYV